MSCENPLIAIRRQDGSIKILRRVDEATDLEKKYGRSNVLYLPCGHCPSCILKYRENWSIRCEMESLMHDKSCMITLTYDNRYLPDRPLKSDLNRFIKRMRNRGHNVRFFGCGERGSHTNRSHYHLILFGYFPDDLKYYGESKSGFGIFTSKYIDGIWRMGNCYVSEFNHKVAAYVAGYVGKKEGSDNFLIMSKKPGLGFEYLNKNVAKLFKYQNYIGINGKVHPLPRYFDTIAELNGFDMLYIKNKKKEESYKVIDSMLLEKNMSHQVEMFRSNGATMKDKLHRLKRGL